MVAVEGVGNFGNDFSPPQLKGQHMYEQQIESWSGEVSATECKECGAIANFDSGSIKEGKCHESKERKKLC